MISIQAQPAVVAMTVVDAAGTSRPFQLMSDHSVFVGTSPNCGLPLDGAGVSDMHCYMKFEDGKLWIEDWMSKSGTLVNGNPIATRVELRTGDCVQVGPHKITLQGKADSQATVVLASDSVSAVTQAAEASGDGSLADNQAWASDEPGERAASDPHFERQSSVAADEATVIEFDSSLFALDIEESCDPETVALLRAEIEHLQATLASRDAVGLCGGAGDELTASLVSEDGDSVLQRMQELIEEANRSDERVSLLEEMLHAAENANRSEQDERQQLEAWVEDIENRVGQREEEHQAELDALRQRLDESQQLQERLVQQLRQAASSGTAPQHYQEHFDELQHSHQQLQEELAEARKHCHSLQQRLAHVSEEQERALREERANLAKEHAKVARLRYELSSKLAAFEDLPKNENLRDTEAAHRLKVLREHLREIHDQEKNEEKPMSLAGRLAKLWHRVDY